MARIRTIKPEFYSSPDTARLSRDARLFFLQLLTQLDDEGRTHWLPKTLAGALYPFDDDVDAALITKWADECCEGPDPMLLRYEVAGREYICAPKFPTHQVINKPTKSRIPAPDDISEDSGSTPVVLREDSGSTTGTEVGSRNKEVGSRNKEKEALAPLAGSSSETSSSLNGQPAIAVPDDAQRLCNLLADLMVSNGIVKKRPTIGKSWPVEADRLFRINGIDPVEAEAVLRWALNDVGRGPWAGWRSNIGSIPTFREKYPKLVDGWKASKRPNGNGRPNRTTTALDVIETTDLEES